MELSLPLFSLSSLFALSLNLISALYQLVSPLPRFLKSQKTEKLSFFLMFIFLSSVALQLSVDAGLRMLRITEPQKPQVLRSSNNTTSEDSGKLIIPRNQDNVKSNGVINQSLISSEDQKLSVCNNTSMPMNHLDLLNCTTNTTISKEQVTSGPQFYKVFLRILLISCYGFLVNFFIVLILRLFICFVFGSIQSAIKWIKP